MGKTGRLVVFNHLTLDGVIHAPARPDEDRRGGFAHGGWAAPRMAANDPGAVGEGNWEFLFGRRTYEEFASFWPHQPAERPFAAALNNGRKYVASRTLEEPLAWQHTTPEQAAEALQEIGVTASNYYHLFGTTLAERNLADAASLAANVADFRQVVRFCRAAAIPTVMVLPGVVNPGQTRAAALAQSARSLAELAPPAAESGVALTVEPHVHSYLESPALVAELLARVSGLRLTLDYAHFICLGYRQEEIDPLAAHAAHVQLRQARPGALQAKREQGTINFPALLGTLRTCGYRGYLALEYVHQAYMDTLYDDVLTETVRLRDLVRSYLRAGAATARPTAAS